MHTKIEEFLSLISLVGENKLHSIRQKEKNVKKNINNKKHKYIYGSK